MKEFVARFASNNEGSFLFEILHRVSRLDPLAMVTSDSAKWVEWPPSDDPGGVGGSGFGVAPA
jgi:hypothetical protein